jgi:hypothetical protein
MALFAGHRKIKYRIHHHPTAARGSGDWNCIFEGGLFGGGAGSTARKPLPDDSSHRASAKVQGIPWVNNGFMSSVPYF